MSFYLPLPGQGSNCILDSASALQPMHLPLLPLQHRPAGPLVQTERHGPAHQGRGVGVRVCVAAAASQQGGSCNTSSFSVALAVLSMRCQSCWDECRHESQLRWIGERALLCCNGPWVRYMVKLQEVSSSAKGIPYF